jgi:hypothetical protein
LEQKQPEAAATVADLYLSLGCQQEGNNGEANEY